MYEFPDPNPQDGCEPDTLLSEGVTLTTGRGEELLGPKPPERSIPVVVADVPAHLHNGDQKIVGATAVMLLDEDRRRQTGLVQNVGSVNIRVGARGVTSTTGLRLIPNAIEIFGGSDAKGEVWAVSESGADALVFRQQSLLEHVRSEREPHAHDSDDCD